MNTQPRNPPIQLPPGTHDPTLAALLTLALITGGQFFNKQHLKAVVTLLITIFLAVTTAGIALLVLYPVCAIDAYRVAERLNRGEAVDSWQWF